MAYFSGIPTSMEIGAYRESSLHLFVPLSLDFYFHLSMVSSPLFQSRGHDILLAFLMLVSSMF